MLDRPQAIELNLAAMGTNRLKPPKNSPWVFGGQLNAKESLHLKISNMQYDIYQSIQKETGCNLTYQKKFPSFSAYAASRYLASSQNNFLKNGVSHPKEDFDSCGIMFVQKSKAY